MISKPGPGEYNPYYQSYIDALDVSDPLKELELNMHLIMAFIGKSSAEMGDFAYSEGKWTVKEVLGHIMDVERVMCYRALMISRCDDKAILSFDDQLYVQNSGVKQRDLSDLANEYEWMRKNTLAFFMGLSEEQSLRKKDMGEFALSVRALLYIIAGHELHHFKVLKDRYFGKTLIL